MALEFINITDEAKAYLDLEFLVGPIGKEQVDEFRRNCLEFYVTNFCLGFRFSNRKWHSTQIGKRHFQKSGKYVRL